MTDSFTERQKTWFASLREGLERETGRNLAEWVAIARRCPETKPRARLAWMKKEHGLGQNRASLVMEEAFPSATGWDDPKALAGALWSDPAALALFEALKAAMLELPGVVVGQRKGYTAFSRKVQFAAARPDRGALRLGLAVAPAMFPALVPAGRASWSERLTAEARIADKAGIVALRTAIRAAWESA